jgi:hypothetical protein
MPDNLTEILFVVALYRAGFSRRCGSFIFGLSADPIEELLTGPRQLVLQRSGTTGGRRCEP